MKHVIAISQQPENYIQPITRDLKGPGWHVNIVAPAGVVIEKALAERGDQVHKTIILLDCDSNANPRAHETWIGYLRNQLYRCPVIVLSEPKLGRRYSQGDLWFVQKPPNPDILDIAFDEATPCAEDTLYERVEWQIVAIADEWEALQRKLVGVSDRLTLIEQVEYLAKQIRRDAALCNDSTIRQWLNSAQIYVDALRESQSVPRETIRNFTSTAAQAYGTVPQSSKSGAEWAVRLHELNNKVLSFADTQEWTTHRDELLQLLKPLAQRGAPYRDPLTASGTDRLLNEFYNGLESVPAHADTSLVADLRNLCDAHQDAINTLMAWAVDHRLKPIGGKSGHYGKIIIVEDDDTWREKLIHLLQTRFPDMALVTATDYDEARKRIQASNQPAIVLVDIGLPPAIEQHLGLRLLDEFVTARPQDRYIVLTAAEDYPEVNRPASLAGVSPHDYILKNPYHWEAEVTTRIEAALQPPDHSLNIEVYKCTGRLIRINGVEIELNQKPFQFFLFLAASRGKWSARQILKRVTGHPYNVFDDPGEGRPQHIHDYVHTIRQAIVSAFQAVQQPIDPSEIINTEEEIGNTELDSRERRYYLCGTPIIYRTFEEIPNTRPRLRVLVVEDEPHYTQAIVDALSTRGIACETAGSVTEARQKIDDLMPQIVTLDLQLPREPGAVPETLGSEVLDYLKEHVVEPRVAVLTSIERQDAERLKLLRKGVRIHDYLSKTWDHAIDRLMRSVWRLVCEQERGLTFAHTEGPPVVHSVRLNDAQPNWVWIDNMAVKLPPGPYELLRILAEFRNVPVTRDLLLDRLWPDPDQWPDNINGALTTKMRQLKDAILRETQGQINPDHLIRSHDGGYWLQAFVSHSDP